MNRHWRRVFGALFVCSWAGNQFSPMLLLYKEVDHYSAATVTLFLGIYVAGLAPALVIAGAISDHIGRRIPMLWAVAFGLVGSTFLALDGFGQVPILIGRLLAGMSVGTAMAVGTTWLKELSMPPHDPRADAGAGARRTSLAFTLGSALGALVAGCIAQWGPWPHVLPFAIHLAVTVGFLWLIRTVPETVPARGTGDLRSGLRVRSARHRRFVRVVAVCGPWLFIACGLSYGYQPVLLADAAGSLGLAYATLLSVIALGSGALIQPVAKRIDSVSSARGLIVALLTLLVGLGVMIAATSSDSLILGVCASVVLGAGFGIGLVSGLLEVQRIAPADELAKLTGVFYAVAYIGFAAPTVLAALTPPFTTVELLLVLAGLLTVSLLVVVRGSRRHLPAHGGVASTQSAAQRAPSAAH
ncbi:MFS transporter [Gordonia bronchialis]|uniref:MFS transporter n=1 Tax=Gordonia bronchialis TaxID=2054 RepID=UPI001CBAB9E5|nr:MFS transporter [Gordonia bronchialis]UAK36369.1 MFS transporter [Gordonia bronchialis]